MELSRDPKQDGFSAVSERQGEDTHSRLMFALAACLGAGGIVASLIFGLLGHPGLHTLGIG